MENQLVTILLDIQKDVAETKAAVNALAGPDGRVTALEKSASFNRWYSLCIVPFIGIAHAVARKAGVNV